MTGLHSCKTRVQHGQCTAVRWVSSTTATADTIAQEHSSAVNAVYPTCRVDSTALHTQCMRCQLPGTSRPSPRHTQLRLTSNAAAAEAAKALPGCCIAATFTQRARLEPAVAERWVTWRDMERAMLTKSMYVEEGAGREDEDVACKLCRMI